MEFTREMIEKAMAAKSVEELMALAKENGIELTAEQAEEYFAQLNPKLGELSDDELDDVSGGGCGGSKEPTVDIPYGTHVMPIGVYRCWNIPDDDARICSLGKVRGGCNSVYFRVIGTWDIMKSVKVTCPDCGRVLYLPSDQIRIL